MEGYIDENRWIDLSSLPRKAYGSKTRIDWKNSVGYILPFKYCAIDNGVLRICGYEVSESGNSCVYITIDKYLPEPTRVNVSELFYFKLHHFIKNKIIDYAPWMQQYMADPADAYKYTYCNNNYVNTKCPICGHLDKKIVANMYCRGFRCIVCDTNLSFPNKLMRAILTQLSIDFIPEVGSRHGFNWMKKYLYDFYLRDSTGKNILIEMDGGFHRYEEQQSVDSKKTELAIANNFNIIRIDCMYKDFDKFEYIKDKIINSELSGILPLDKIDWNTCLVDVQKNIFLEVCKMYDEGESIEDISREVKLSRTTIHKYIQQGHSIGVCKTYVGCKQVQRRDFKRIAQIVDGNVIRVFASALEVEALSDDLYGIHFTRQQVWQMCREETSYSSILKFKYITKEEYKQYKMINNEVVLKEAI